MTTSKNAIFVGVIFHTLVYRFFSILMYFFFFKEDGEIITILVHGGGGVLDISLGGEVRRGLSYPDPV